MRDAARPLVVKRWIMERYSRRRMMITTGAAMADTLATSPKKAAAQPGTDIDMDLEINRNGSRPSGRGPAEWFTGAVRVDPLF